MRKHLQHSIKQLSACYGKGTYSPCEVVQNALEDAEKYKAFNAFIRLTPELALQKAKESEQRYQDGQAKSVLDGVPIAIKDNFCTEGIHTTCASKMLKNFIPPYNATVCQRLFDAGAVLIGKTNMDEFAMGSGSVDSIFGPVKNSWSESIKDNEYRVAGGSSGGSAVSVASGTCFAAIGSDTGGSTRNPASYCGLVGLKLSYGLSSRLGLIPLVHTMDVPGIFARSVSDCVEVLNIIAGPDEKDPTSWQRPYKPINLPQPDILDLSKIRIGIPKEYECRGLSPEVLQTWRQVSDMLANSGAQVRQVSMPNTEASIVVYFILNQCEVASNMSCYDGLRYGHRAASASSAEELFAKTRAEGFNEVVKQRILSGNYFLMRANYETYFKKALKVRRLIYDDFMHVFERAPSEERVDLLLTPTTITDAPLYKDFVMASSRDQSEVQDFCTQTANMAGVPGINIPICLSKQGLPIGLQLMSNNFNEDLLLAVSHWIEAQMKFDVLSNPQLQKIC